MHVGGRGDGRPPEAVGRATICTWSRPGRGRWDWPRSARPPGVWRRPNELPTTTSRQCRPGPEAHHPDQGDIDLAQQLVSLQPIRSAVRPWPARPTAARMLPTAARPRGEAAQRLARPRLSVSPCRARPVPYRGPRSRSMDLRAAPPPSTSAMLASACRARDGTRAPGRSEPEADEPRLVEPRARLPPCIARRLPPYVMAGWVVRPRRTRRRCRLVSGHPPPRAAAMLRTRA